MDGDDIEDETKRNGVSKASRRMCTPPSAPTTTSRRVSEANIHAEEAAVEEMVLAAATPAAAAYFASLLYKMHIAMDVIVSEYITIANTVAIHIWKREEALGKGTPFRSLLLLPYTQRNMHEQIFLVLSSVAWREEHTTGRAEEKETSSVCRPSEGTAGTPVLPHVSSVERGPLCAKDGEVGEKKDTRTSVEQMSAVDRQTYLFLHAYSFF